MLMDRIRSDDMNEECLWTEYSYEECELLGQNALGQRHYEDCELLIFFLGQYALGQ